MKMAVITGGREYSENVIFSLSQIRETQAAQKAILDEGFGANSETRLKTALGLGITILGLIFVTSTPAGVATIVLGLITTLSASRKEGLEKLVNDGYSGISYWETWMQSRTQYSQIEVEFPFIEYTVDGSTIRFITGDGVLKRVRTSSGWLLP